MNKSYVDIANSYIRAALADRSGKRFSKWVRLACQRQRDDLKRFKSKSAEYYFDPAAAADVCDFIEKLPHVEGRWDQPTLKLEPAQIFILTTVFGWRRRADGGRRFSRAYIECARKNAKAEAITNEIPTPSGIKLIGDLRPGDHVYGSAGEPIQVRAVSPVMRGRDCYRVRFDDGSTVVVAGDHRWTLRVKTPAAKITSTSTATLTTEQIAADLRTTRKRFYVPLVRVGGPAAKHRERPYRIGTRAIAEGGRIPAAYLRGSWGQRLELLRSIVDGSGAIRAKRRWYRIDCHSEGFRQDVAELINSMGSVALIDGNRVRFQPPPGLHCWDIQSTFTDNPKLQPTRQLVAVEKVASVPVRCIEVAADDGLYLTSRAFIATHNSTLTAGVGLYGLTCEGEPGAQVLCAASTGAQAKKVFGPAKQMVERTADLREAFGLEAWAQSITARDGSFMQPVNSKSSTQDGWNPHLVILDELHAHKDRGLYDVMRSAMGARSNPLQWIITTAGYDLEGVCYEQRQLVEKVLLGVVPADHLFGIIYSLDQGDDPFDESKWIKANPLLGVSVKLADMQAYAREAQHSPASLGEFKTKRLNLWLSSSSTWLDLPTYDSCADPGLTIDQFEGSPCWIGADLSDKSDITAIVALFEREGRLYAFPRFYLPRDLVEEKARSTGTHYDVWSRQEGDKPAPLTLTDGDYIDHRRVEADLIAWAERFKPSKIIFDQFSSAGPMVSRLNEGGFNAVTMAKSARSFTEPARDLEARLRAKRLIHDGNPVLRWMASNCVVDRRVDGSLLPKKESANSANKIDGIDALLLAMIGRGTTTEGDDEGTFDQFIANPIRLGRVA